MERFVTVSLAAAFRSGNSRKVKWQGKVVHSLVQLHAKEGDTIEVERISSSTTRAQALKIAVDKGNLRANGVLMPEAAIWTHTSPVLATLEVVGRKVRSVDIWNSWSFDGVDSSWIGSAGMLVETNGDQHTLRCSDGLGDPTFDDLIVNVVVRHV
jgi:hypothetical protein